MAHPLPAPEVLHLCSQVLHIVGIVRMGLEPSEQDLEAAVHATETALHARKHHHLMETVHIDTAAAGTDD